MKTFKQFIEESNTTLRLIRKSAELIKANKNPDVYKNLLKKASERLNPKDSIDYPGRTSAEEIKLSSHLIEPVVFQNLLVFLQKLKIQRN